MKRTSAERGKAQPANESRQRSENETRKRRKNIFNIYRSALFAWIWIMARIEFLKHIEMKQQKQQQKRVKERNKII